MNSISIIVCFYNSGNKLVNTLNYLKKIDISSVLNVELILVDNNSNDDSALIINESLIDFDKYTWKIVHESKPGLSHARLKGIKESKYEFLLFCDDDNWLETNYLSIGCAILQKDHRIAVLGGFGEPVSDVSLPNWFEHYKNFYAVGEQMPSSGLVRGARNVVYGAGMFVRKDAFNFIVSKGFNFYNLGRTGKKLTSGEDSEMCLAFQIAGYKIWYEKSLTFKHQIVSSRLTLDYLKKLKNGMIDSGYVSRFYRDYLFGYVPQITRFFWLKEFLYNIFDFIKNIFTISKSDKIIRNIKFGFYLLKQRSKYQYDVSRIIGICKSLDNKSNN